MRILFVTPPPYLPNRLHRARAFDLIKILAKNHDVNLLSMITDKEEPLEFDNIKRVCKSVTVIKLSFLKAVMNCFRFPHLPYEVAYCYSKEAEEKISEIIKKEKIDLLYVKRLRSGVFLPKVNIPVILDTTDAMSMFYYRMFQHHTFPKNLFYLLESIKYKRFENKIMKYIKNWIVCSEIDKEYLEKFDNSLNFHVIQNPVDTEYFKNHSKQAKLESEVLLFRGLMDKPVNIDAVLFFINRIFPLIKQKIKRKVNLFIVGPNPCSSVRKLGNNKDIFVTGFVEDVREYIKNSKVIICSVRIGSGTRFKILQAWAMSRPVVSTTIGAEGLLYKDGENIEIADNPEDFAEKVIKLFNNKKHYNKLTKNGNKLVEKEYSLKAVQKKLEKTLRNVVKN